MEYQIHQDKARLKEIQEKVRAEESKLVAIHPISRTHSEIDEMGKKTLTGNVTVSQVDFDTLTQLAKEGVSGRGQLSRLKEENSQLQAKIWSLQGSLNRLQGQFNELAERCRPYLEAVRFMPEKVKELLDSVLAPLRKHQEEQGRSIMYVKGKSQESRGDIR